MKKCIWILAMVLIATNVFAAEINFTIPDAKLPRVVDAMVGMFGVEGEAPDEDGDGTPDFTPNQWAKECVRRWIIQTVRRWEASEAGKAAMAAIPPDNELVN
jgi:hypothetical protein